MKVRLLDEFREWMRHRHDRPPLIPDPVTKKVPFQLDPIVGQQDRRQATIRHYSDYGWEFVGDENSTVEGVVRLVFVRHDGLMGGGTGTRRGNP